MDASMVTVIVLAVNRPLLLHGGFEVLGASSSSKHWVSICIDASHFSQLAFGGAQDVTACTRNCNLNLMWYPHCIVDKTFVTLVFDVEKWAHTVPCSWPLGHWPPHLKRSRTLSDKSIHTCWRVCIFWPLEAAEQFIKNIIKCINTFNTEFRSLQLKVCM